MGEITKGISALKEGARKRSLEQWLQNIIRHNASQILDINTNVATTWGELSSRAQRQGRHLHMADSLITTTALCHNMYLVTQNIKDFEHTGVLLVNPWLT